MSTVLLSCLPLRHAEELRSAIAAAGFAVIDHALGSTPAVNFEPIAVAVMVVEDRVEVAAAQTRRWRIELGDQVLPILWILPRPSNEIAVQGLNAGADAILAQPLDPATLAAQVKALARTHAGAARLGVKAGEARLLGEQLRKAYSQLEREWELGRRIQRNSLAQTFPEVGGIRFSLCHRPQSNNGGDFYDVRRLDEFHVGFLLGDVCRGASGSLLGVFALQAARNHRCVPPEEVLIGVNRELIGLGLEESPLVAMLAGTVDARDGSLAIARAGLPAPVFLPVNGDPYHWTVPGPFLGTSDTTYSPLHGILAHGDKLLIGSDGVGPPDRLLEAATRHRAFSGQAFVDAVARELLPYEREADDFTLLSVEMH